MVHYVDSPTINKRIVAGYYLFLSLVGFVILLGPTGGGIPVASIGSDEYHSYDLATPGMTTNIDNCAGCHADQHGNWSTSAHASHIIKWNDTLIGIGTGYNVSITLFNSTCSECHTSGWDNSTGTPTYDALNINCYVCHNSSGYVDYAGDVCGTCHRPIFDQPNQYVPWQNSAHANSLTDLRASGHAASYCMHCMSGEGFINHQNPDMLSSGVSLDWNPEGNYNSISCPACHAVHANWTSVSPHAIRAVNASELCILCHQGLYIWYGGTHNIVGVECIDCHGYDLVNVTDPDSYFLNHTFVVDPALACGQSVECHEGQEEWALNQLENIGDAFDALSDEILTEATSFELQVQAFNQSAGANATFANEMQEIIDDVRDRVQALVDDDSHGFHNPVAITEALNDAYRELLDAKAVFYQYVPTFTVTNTVTETTVVVVTSSPADLMLPVIAGAIGGILIGLLVGAIIGKRIFD